MSEISREASRQVPNGWEATNGIEAGSLVGQEPPAAVRGPRLRLRGLAVGYGARWVLTGIDLDLQPGECWLLRGPNGSGKTTLLRTLGGLLPPLEGTLERADGLKLGYVPADTAMRTTLPLRLDEVVLMGASQLQPRGPGWRRDLRQRAGQLLVEAGLWEVRGQSFSQSSSGQKQRALLARAIMGAPHLLLMDEPTSNLDADSVSYFMGQLQGLRDTGVGMLVSTHAHDQFEPLQPRILELHAGSIRPA